MSPKLLFFTTFLLTLGSCTSETRTTQENASQTTQKPAGEMKAIVENSRELDSIPSGSGLVKDGENFYLISDDSPYFFKLSSEFGLLEKYAIQKGQKAAGFRIPKARKPDYESATFAQWNGRKYLLAFGSGSKSPERDSLLLVPLNQPENAQTFSLKPLYDLLKKQSQLPDEELNIEGSALVGEELFLFNRGQNVLVQTNWSETVAFLTQKAAAPEVKTYRIALPQIKGISPGFSGACQLGNEPKILFTASVENTQNWIDDGEILGSFIGVLNLEKRSTDPLESVALLTDKNGKAVIEKVESIEFLNRATDGKIKVLCLTDDDKGGSKILEVSLQF